MNYEEILNSIDNSLENVDIDYMLDSFPIEDRNHNFENILQKLRHGGLVSLKGFDLIDASRAVMRRDLSPKEFEDQVYSRKSASNVLDVTQVLENYGFQIVRRRLNNYEYYLQARRP